MRDTLKWRIERRCRRSGELMTARTKPGMLAALVCCGALVLAGCASGDSGSADASASPASSEGASEAPAEEASGADLEALGDVEVDQGLLSVTITLPADFAEDVTQADIDASIASGEIQDGQINDDGTVTYQLSKSQHEESLSELRGSVDQVIADENTTNPGLYEDVTYNDDMTQFTVVVADRQKYEQSMSMLGFGLLFGAAFYQIFYGVPEADRNVVIEYVDAATGEVFDTYDASKDMS
jgi:hypothetical protein